MAENTPNLNLPQPDHGSYPNTWEQPLNEALSSIDAAFDPTNGHDHTGTEGVGKGPKLDHTAALLNVGTNTHDDIDTHIADTTLHTDTMISEIVDDDNTVTVSDVVSLHFAGATVTTTGAGVAVVTFVPGNGGGGGGTTNPYSKPDSAPVAYTDNFNWPAGQPLDAHCWHVASDTSGAYPFYVGGEAGGSGTCAELITADFTTPDIDQVPTGHSSAHNSCHIPHGVIQRVTLMVEKFEPAAVTSTGVSGLNNVGWKDSYTLSLDLLADNSLTGTTSNGSSSAPCPLGVSLMITKPTQDNGLFYAIRVRSHLSLPEVRYTLFPAPTDSSGTITDQWQDLPLSYMYGCHEFSLHRSYVSETAPDTYTLSYYYNSGLIFSHTFAENDGTDIWEEIESLRTRLVAKDTVPNFGRMGFSVGWDLDPAKNHKFLVRIKCVTLTSQDEEAIRRVVGPLPDANTPPAPDTNPIQACSSGVFSDVYVGDYFDLDGTSTNYGGSDWKVISATPAGGSANGASFKVTNTQTEESWDIYCDLPTVIENTAYIFPGQRLDIPLPGRGLPRSTCVKLPISNPPLPGLHGNAVFQFNNNGVPKNWKAPTAGGPTYVIGDAVPTNFVELRSYHANNTVLADGTPGDRDANGNTTIVFDVIPGDLLPYGTEFVLTGTPSYETSYTFTWDASLRVGSAPPYLNTPGDGQIIYTVLVWDTVTNPALPAWKKINPGDDIFEGSTIAVGVSGHNLPLGKYFWNYGFEGTGGYWWRSDSTGTVDPGASWTSVSAGTPQKAFARIPNNDVRAKLLFDKFYPGWLQHDTTMLPTAPPTSAVAANNAASVAPTFSSVTTGQSWLWIGQLDNSLWTSLNASTVDFTIGAVVNDVLSQASEPVWGSSRYNFVLDHQIVPKNIEQIAFSVNGAITVGSTPYLLATLKNLKNAADLLVYRTSGFASNTVITPTSVTSTDGGITWVVRIDASLSGSTGQDIVLTFRKSSMYDWLAAVSAEAIQYASDYPDNTGEVSVNFGTTDGIVGPEFEAGSLVGSLVEDVMNNTITIDVKGMPDNGVGGAVEGNWEFSIDPPVHIENIAQTSVADINGYVTYTLTVSVVDTSHEIPGTYTDADLRVTYNGITDTYTVPITTASDPVINDIYVYDIDGMTELAVWKIDKDVPSRVVYFDISNAKPGFTVTVIQPTPPVGGSTGGGAVFTNNNSNTITPTWITGTVYSAQMTINPWTYPDTTLSFTVNNPSVSGETRADVSTDALTFIGAGRIYTIAMAANCFVQKMTSINLAASLVNPDATTLIVDFVDSTGTSLLDGSIRAVLVDPDSQNTSRILARGRFAVGTVDTAVYIKITNPEATPTEVIGPVATGRTVTWFALPNVTSLPINIDVATTTISVVVTGTGLKYINTPEEGSFDYSLSAGSGITINSSTITANSPSKLTITASVTITSPGGFVYVNIADPSIDGGSVIFPIAYVEAGATATPAITSVYLTDPLVPGDPAPCGNGLKATLTINGTDLNSGNVEDVYLTLCGIDGTVEMPPGQALDPAFKAGPNWHVTRIGGSTLSMTGTTLTATFPAEVAYANCQVKVWLTIPASHPDYATYSGVWPTDDGVICDNTSGSGIHSIIATAQYGDTSNGPYLNTDPGMVGSGGITQLVTARDFQRQIGLNTWSGAEWMTLTVMLSSAYHGEGIVATEDSGYSVSNITVEVDPGLLMLYVAFYPPAEPDSCWDPVNNPISIGLQFDSGKPICAAVMGRTNWGDTTGQLPYDI